MKDREIHVWLPGDRSLCDRARLTRARSGDEDKVIDPACGACMLLVSYLRRQAAAILKLTPGVMPGTPSEAWVSLKPTRWGAALDIDGLLEDPELDTRSRFDALELAVDPATVDLVIERWREGR